MSSLPCSVNPRLVICLPHYLKHLHLALHQKQIHVSQHILSGQPAECAQSDFEVKRFLDNIQFHIYLYLDRKM